MRLVLASASPRRTALLSEWGLAHEVCPSTLDESAFEAEAPAALARLLARNKALDVAARRSAAGDEGSLVLGADTVVSLEGRSLGKPADEGEALAMLMAQSGRIVEVHTGVALVPTKRLDELRSEVVTTRVFMRAFDAEEARAYVATGEPADKAGAFAIQGLGGRLVDRLEGSRSNVVGLPRALVLGWLAEVAG